MLAGLAVLKSTAGKPKATGCLLLPCLLLETVGPVFGLYFPEVIYVHILFW